MLACDPLTTLISAIRCVVKALIRLRACGKEDVRLVLALWTKEP